MSKRILRIVRARSYACSVYNISFFLSHLVVAHVAHLRSNSHKKSWFDVYSAGGSCVCKLSKWIEQTHGRLSALRVMSLRGKKQSNDVLIIVTLTNALFVSVYREIQPTCFARTRADARLGKLPPSIWMLEQLEELDLRGTCVCASVLTSDLSPSYHCSWVILLRFSRLAVFRKRLERDTTRNFRDAEIEGT